MDDYVQPGKRSLLRKWTQRGVHCTLNVGKMQIARQSGLNFVIIF